MNYIVISPYYPQNFQQFTVELANKGITVLGIGQEPYEQLDQPLKDALTEYFRVDNLENLDEVKRAVAFLFYKHGPIESNHIMNTGWNWMQLFVNSLMYLVLSQRTSRRQNTNLK